MLPKALKHGDKIGIVAPAKRISIEEVSYALSIFKSWGLDPILGKSIGSGTYLFSGEDDFRAEDTQDFINNPEIKAIFSARGGYGCVRIIDKLDFSEMIKQSKWMIGFSDFTVFHNHLFQQYNYPTVHASMPVFFTQNTPAALKSLHQLIFHHQFSYTIESAFPEYCIDGNAFAPINGGNLSVMYSLNGSRSALKDEAIILFLEDLSEYYYHTDRMMQNLFRSGMFTNLKGVIIGAFTEMKDGALPFGKNAYALIFDYFKQLNIPVFSGFPAGHVVDNRALIFGKNVQLSVKDNQLNLNW